MARPSAGSSRRAQEALRRRSSCAYGAEARGHMPSRSRTGTSGDRVQRPCTLACTADVVPTEALALVSTMCIASLRSTLLAHAHAGCEGVRKAELKGEQQQRSLRPGFSRGDGRGRVRCPDSCK